jgi:hypothetical protein
MRKNKNGVRGQQKSAIFYVINYRNSKGLGKLFLNDFF